MAEMKAYRGSVQAAIDKYALFLDASELERLEHSATSPILDILIEFPGADVLSHPGDMQAHVKGFLSVCEAFNAACPGDALTVYSVTIWSRAMDLGPLVASARRSTKPTPAKLAPLDF